jgi:hypothetical protein
MIDFFDEIVNSIEREIALDLGDCFWIKGTQFANPSPDDDTLDMWIRNWSGRATNNTNRLWNLLVTYKARINRLELENKNNE